MFTGLVQEVGRVLSKDLTSSRAKLRIQTQNTRLLQIGDSIAVNGVCLTVTGLTDEWFEADVMPRTWKGTNLRFLTSRAPVNLEPALKLGDSLGGHLVSGHVDGVGKITEIRKEKNAVLFTLSLSRDLTGYLVEKASIALDGVSLTIQEITGDKLVISMIPHTFAQTRFQWSKPGDLVNVEVDIFAKQALKNMRQVQKGITTDFLRTYGYIK